MKNDLREKLELPNWICYGEILGEDESDPTHLTTYSEKENGCPEHPFSGGGSLPKELIEALFVALLDEVMGKVIGEDDKGEIGDTYAFAARERNDLRATQRQALQAIRDSVSGGTGK